MIVKLLTEHHLEFLSLKGDYRGSSESTHPKFVFASAFVYKRMVAMKSIMDSIMDNYVNKRSQSLA